MQLEAPVRQPSRLLSAVRSARRFADAASPVAELLLRLWVAQAFWMSGREKIQSWDTTLQLFKNEYHVPLLSPTVAAYLAAFGELSLPVLLVLGIGGRVAAAGLFIVNAVAVISYPDLNAAGLAMHRAWGVALLLLALRGPGKLSLDHFAGRRLGWC
jgi:putative oxidoreductase